MRLLCDEMLGGLARWLRAAGHDAALARGAQDDVGLVARCRGEGRTLVTRDRKLALAARADAAAVLLTSEDADRQAVELARTLGLDWMAAPFTRCVVDNAVLEEAGPEDLERLPGDTRELPGPFRRCPACGRLYWPGSHVRRMRATLERWRALAATGRTS